MSRLAAGLSVLLETEIISKPIEESEDPGAEGGGSASDLTEDDQTIGPPPRPGAGEGGGDLLECCMDTISYGYSERSFEDKLRDACATLRYAIQDEAYKGLGDDGKTRRRIEDDEDHPWQAVENLLMKEIYPNKFKDLVGAARAELNKYYE